MSAANFQFLDSETQSVSQTMLIGVAGPTGAGKTESAIRIAKGVADAQKGEFCVIDTENKRALNKKSRYRFKHLDMQAPYSPENYEAAIRAAIKEGFRAVVVDSFSHEWDGEGGLHEDAMEILERISKGDPVRAEKLTALAWKQPKQRHKKLMGYLRKCEVPIIFGLRAEPKIKFQKDKDGKMQVVDAGWLPIAEKMFGFDMLIYALLMAENPGVPVHLKKLEPEFEPMFPIGKQITEESGRLLSAWAKGLAAPQSPRPPSSSSGSGTTAGAASPVKTRTEVLTELCERASVKLADVLARAEVKHADEMSQQDYDDATAALKRRAAKATA